MDKTRLEYILYALVAFTYALLLSYVPEIILRDRDNYLIYATDPMGVYDNVLAVSVPAFLSNEPLFFLLNYLLGFIIDPFMIPSIISFFISFVFVFFILREVEGGFNKILALIVFSCTPTSFHLQLVILRQGLALALLLIIIMNTNNKKYWYVGAFILGFIHSSFFIISFLFFIIYLVRNLKFSSQLLIYFLVSFAVSVLTVSIGQLFGARQVDLYQSASAGGSGLAFLLYLAMLCLILSRGSAFLQKFNYESITIFGLILYLVLYFTSPIAGRLIITFLPFIVCLLLNTKSITSYIFIILYLILNLMIYSSTVVNNSLIDGLSNINQIFLS